MKKCFKLWHKCKVLSGCISCISLLPVSSADEEKHIGRTGLLKPSLYCVMLLISTVFSVHLCQLDLLKCSCTCLRGFGYHGLSAVLLYERLLLILFVALCTTRASRQTYCRFTLLLDV